MAGGENRLRANVCCGAPADLAAAPRAPAARTLIVVTAATALGLAGLRLALPAVCGLQAAGAQQRVFNTAFLAFDLAFCCCAALGAAVYCFAAFAISRLLRDLLASVGLCALSSAAGLQALADLSSSAPWPDERIITSGLLYASCAFFAASFAGKSWRPESRVGSWAQLAAGLMTTAVFPLVMLPDAVGGRDTAAGAAYGMGSRAALVAAVLLVGAAAGAFRLRRSVEQSASGIESYFFVSLAFAALSRALSSARFDCWWVCGQVLFLESWLVFVGVGSVENAVAHKERADRLDEMEALHDISWALVGAKTVRELVNLLANTVREKLGAAIVAVYLADEARESLEVAAISGPEICLKSLGARYRLLSTDRRPGFHSGHTARAFTTKEVQVAADVFVDVELVPWRIIARENGCAVSLPLIDKGEACGVLNLYFSDQRLLSPQRLRLLRTIAAAAGPAIENARSSETFRTGIRELNRAA